MNRYIIQSNEELQFIFETILEKISTAFKNKQVLIFKFLDNFNINVNLSNYSDPKFVFNLSKMFNHFFELVFDKFLHTFTFENLTPDQKTKNNNFLDLILYLNLNDAMHLDFKQATVKVEDFRKSHLLFIEHFDDSIYLQILANLKLKVFHAKNENYNQNLNEINVTLFNFLFIVQKYSNIIHIENIKTAFHKVLYKIERNGILDINQASLFQRSVIEVDFLILFNLIHFYFDELSQEIAQKICSICELISIVKRFCFLQNAGHRKIYIASILDIVNRPSIINNLKEEFVFSILETLEHLFLKLQSDENRAKIEPSTFELQLFGVFKEYQEIQKEKLPRLPIVNLNELRYFTNTVQTHSKNIIPTRRRIQKNPPSLHQNSGEICTFCKEQSLVILSKIESLKNLKLTQKLFYNLQNTIGNNPRIIINLD